MPNGRDRNSGRTANGEGGMVRAAVLLTLPLLAFQRDLLNIMKAGLEQPPKPETSQSDQGVPARGAGIGDLLQKLTAQELQALMMVLDPSHSLRNSLGVDFPKLAVGVADVSQKLAGGALNIIEAQSKVLEHVIATLRQFK
jgi:hypothetical protein